MFLTLLKLSIRALRFQPMSSTISIIGLGAGLAASLLILTYVEHELGFEDFNERADGLYRLTKEGREALYPAPVAGLIRQMGQVKTVSLVDHTGRPLLSHGNRRGFHPVLSADEQFLDLLDLTLLRGVRSKALVRPHSIVISEPVAREFFGDEDPLGKTLTWDSLFDLEVTGVFDKPTNTHLEYDLIASIRTWEVEPAYGPTSLTDWRGPPHGFYVLLEPGAQVADFSESLLRVATDDGPDWLPDLLQEAGSLPFLRPVKDIHLLERGQMDHVYLLATIGALVLLVACVNFANLSTARSAQRVREVGVRRALGAGQLQLASQFLLESALQVLVAAILGYFVAWLCGPAYLALTGIELRILRHWESLWMHAAGLTAVALLGAGYPAMVLGRSDPTTVIRGHSRDKAGVFLRRRLVEVQLVLAILLILGTLVVHRQLSFMAEADLGLDSEDVLTFHTGYKGVMAHNQEIAAAMAELPGVLGVAGSNNPLFQQSSSSDRVKLHVGDGEAHFIPITVSPTFADVMRLHLIAGRAPRSHMDGRHEFIINESAISALGLKHSEEALGALRFEDGVGIPVVGVVKDFHFQTLHDAIEPMLLKSPGFANSYSTGQRIEYYQHLIVRVDDQALPEVLDRLADAWHRFVPSFPFSYEFIEDAFNHRHRRERQLSGFLSGFAGLSVLLTGLGVFAMATHSAQQRTKEIGVRKVLGARAGHVLMVLGAEFLTMLALAVFIALPTGVWATERWLSGFPYRIEVDVAAAAGAVAVVLGITVLAISQQVMRMARLQPVEALRHE